MSNEVVTETKPRRYIRVSEDVWVLAGHIAKKEGLRNERAAIERIMRLYGAKFFE